MASVECQTLYAISGFEGCCGPHSNKGEKFSSTSNAWLSVATIGTSRYHLGVAALGRFVYAIGGDNNGVILSSVEKYDVDGNSWSYVASLGTARSGMGVATLNGYIYAAGGWGNLQSVERYDATANTWVIAFY
jgi:kelch-like protein 19